MSRCKDSRCRFDRRQCLFGVGYAYAITVQSPARRELNIE